MAAKKNSTAAITIEGPEGVSICSDAHKPSPTEAIPISAPPSAICSGVLLKRLAAETGIIVAGTSSVRQWIQRMGRILRRAPSKEYSKIYVVFVDMIEQDIFTEKDLVDFEKEAMGVELIHLSGRNGTNVA